MTERIALTVGIIGNPNCGKTTIFNGLTGARQKVGNWPGVTVERKVGEFAVDGRQVRLVDLPGTYSLDALSAASVDETIARDYVLSGEADLIINIVDAANLERNLYLTVQLLEMGVPLVMGLNMTDMAESAGISIDIDSLQQRLGCPVIPLQANKKKGLEPLRQVLFSVTNGFSGIHYAEPIENALASLSELLPAYRETFAVSERWSALKLLEGDPLILSRGDDRLREHVNSFRQDIEDTLKEEADIWIADGRYGYIHDLVCAVTTRPDRVRRTLSDRIDAIVLNRYLGIPIFLGIMYLLLVFSFNGGNIFLDFFDQTTGAIFVSGFSALLEMLHSPNWLVTFLADSVGGSIQLVSTFIAPIGMTFLFLSILEDSGYMARAAFVMDRFMRRIGLPGKSFVPMIVGLGCNVPAVMATRTLETPRERLLSVMMQPFMSCSARLVVYMAFVTILFQDYGGQIVFLLYVLGIVVAVATAWMLKSTVLKGEVSPFVMELPPYHVPTPGGVLRGTWNRLKVFLRRVGKVIIVTAMVINLLAGITLQGKALDKAEIGDSILADIGRAVTPVFHPMGITDENWPATVGLLSGIVVKEIVVGTLNSAYSHMDSAVSAPEKSQPFDLWRDIRAALATIPVNFRDFLGGFADPLGFSQFSAGQGDLKAAAEAQDVEVSTLTTMARLFTAPAAIAYLIFVLLYMPCVNTAAAIRRETGSLFWTMFVTGWGLLLAYGLAVSFYQLATLSVVGGLFLVNLSWVTAALISIGLVIAGLRYWGMRRLEVAI